MSNPSESVSKGLDGIIAAKTRLSDVRGEAGELIYAGYDINELAGKVTFEEVIHLLHWNHLPNRKELSELRATLAAERDLPKGVVDILRLVPKDTPPMDIIRTAVSATGCFDPQRDDSSYDDLRRKAMKLIAQIPMITAYFHRIRQGKELLPPNPKLGEAANFLYMMDGELPSQEKVNTMDLCYILHADHGMNASTFSARVTMATMSDMYSAITSAIGTLKGPLHGGANEGVIKMLKEIGSLEKVDAYIEECLAQKKKIMGIGHRVYKTLDPRAPHLKRMAHEYQAKQLLAQYGVPVPPGEVCDTAEAAKTIAEKLFAKGETLVVIKSQIHAGGRGKGTFKSGFQGGVKLCKPPRKFLKRPGHAGQCAGHQTNRPGRPSREQSAGRRRAHNQEGIYCAVCWIAPPPGPSSWSAPKAAWTSRKSRSKSRKKSSRKPLIPRSA
jgi:citrate synthase